MPLSSVKFPNRTERSCRSNGSIITNSPLDFQASGTRRKYCLLVWVPTVESNAPFLVRCDCPASHLPEWTEYTPIHARWNPENYGNDTDLICHKQSSRKVHCARFRVQGRLLVRVPTKTALRARFHSSAESSLKLLWYRTFDFK